MEAAPDPMSIRMEKMDYSDDYAVVYRGGEPMRPEELLASLASDHPAWVRALFRIRDRLAAKRGLKPGGGFADRVVERTDDRVVVEKDDSHLFLRIVLYCTAQEEGCQRVGIATSVVFCNRTGRLYFRFVKPFHGVLCRKALRRAVRRHER